MGLSKKRQTFVNEYLQCWNATEAARRAHYKHPRRQGSRLLTFDDIREEIQTRIEENAMSADEILARLAEQARGEHGEYINTMGGVDIAGLVEDGKAHLIKSVRDTKWGQRFEFYDAQRALELLGKTLGMFVDRKEISGPSGGPVPVRYINDWRKNPRPSDSPSGTASGDTASGQDQMAGGGEAMEKNDAENGHGR